MRHPSELRSWTPVGFSASPSPQLEWGDLRAWRFRGPFFRRTLDAWRASPEIETRTTDLAALAELDDAQSLDPCLIIAHASRCGSTLLARQTSAPESAILVSEPPQLGAFLAHAAAETAFDPEARQLRRLVRAMGRIRFGDESRFVLKLASSYTPHLPRFRRAFPKAAVVWLQRRPAEIVASQLRGPSRWMDADGAPPGAVQQIVLRKLAVVFLAASAHVNSGDRVLDYTDVVAGALGGLGFEPGPEEQPLVDEISRYHAHNGRPFAPRPPAELPGDVAASVARDLDPLYDALATRGAPRAAVV